MSFFSDFKARLHSLLHRSRLDQESQEEFRFHLDMETRKLRDQGLPRREARRRAALSFGGLQAIREETRDARGWRRLEEALRDLRHALRQLRHTPAFTTAVVVTLALGIGATTAIFTVFDALLLRPVPFAEPENLVMVWETDRDTGTNREPASWPDFVDFDERSSTLEGLAAIDGTELNYVPPEGNPVRLTAVGVTANYFDLVGLAPRVGRVFAEEETRPGGPNVALLGERFWRSAFHGDEEVVGSTQSLNDVPYTIVGILPAGADFGLDQIHAQAAYHSPYSGEGEVDVWVPLQADEEQFPRSTHPFLTLARVAPGFSLEQAQEELSAIAAALESEYPQANTARGAHVEPLLDVVLGPVRPVLLLLLGAAILVLVVACANVAGLLLAQGTTRTQEVAVRTALGASTGRLGRQFLVETALLTVLGAGAGIALAYVGLEGLLALAPADLPRLQSVALDGRVLAVTVWVSAGVALLCGSIPTLQALRVNVHDHLKGAGRSLSDGLGRRRLRKVLVVAELTLCVMLLIGAGLLVRSFQAVLAVDAGFDPSRVLKAEFQLPDARYPRDYRQWPNFPEVHQFNARLLTALEDAPGVAAVALSGSHPLDRGFTNSFQIVGREEESADWPEISVRTASPGYFETVGLALRQGRLLQQTDSTDGAAVAVINEAAASLFFGDRDPLGQALRLWGAERTIVGVVANEHFHGLTEAAPIATYLPLTQAPGRTGVMLARTTGEPLSLAPTLRRAVAGIDPALAVSGLEPLTETLNESLRQRRFAMVILLLFAGVTLLLALVGIHGVLSYSTSLRTREMGIRTAFGAAPGQIRRLVLREGLVLGVVGVVLGLVAALIGTRFLGSLLFGIPALDPLTFAGVPVALLSAAALAAWLPALRATRVDPVQALGVE